MRLFGYLVGLAVVLLALGGCITGPNPQLRKQFNEVVEGMDQDDVINIMGPPTYIEDNVIVYVDDYPGEQVRVRFVLDANGIVVEKHYETAEDLAKKKGEKGETDKEQATEKEKEEETYPGGAQPRFRDWRERKTRH